jgi:hypothetical protein
MRTIGYAIMHCTLGDAVVALVGYLAAALAVRDAYWPAREPWRGAAVAIVVGIGWTVMPNGKTYTSPAPGVTRHECRCCSG